MPARRPLLLAVSAIATAIVLSPSRVAIASHPCGDSADSRHASDYEYSNVYTDQPGNNSISFGPGHDEVLLEDSSGGSDNFCGEGDWDRLRGGEGGDVLEGGGHFDLLVGGPGPDVLRGQGGDDRTNDALEPFVFVAGLRGEEGRDDLYGGAGSDALRGGPQDDALFGEEDNDNLIGGDGDDLLVGGAGHDRCVGGGGNDSFVGCENVDR